MSNRDYADRPEVDRPVKEKEVSFEVLPIAIEVREEPVIGGENSRATASRRFKYESGPEMTLPVGNNFVTRDDYGKITRLSSPVLDLTK